MPLVAIVFEYKQGLAAVAREVQHVWAESREAVEQIAGSRRWAHIELNEVAMERRLYGCANPLLFAPDSKIPLR